MNTAIKHNKIFKDRPGSALLLTVLILSAVFVLAFSASYLALYSIKMADVKLQGSKAYFAAEAGAEAIKWEVRKNGLDLNTQSNGIILSGTPFVGGSYEVDFASSSGVSTVTVIGTYNKTRRVFEVQNLN